MNREFFSSISLGSIIICITMVFQFHVSYILIMVLISFSITIYFFFFNTFSSYLLIFSFSIFLGLFGVSRVQIESKTTYTPILNSSIDTGDILILKDSTPLNSGFITSGILYRVKNKTLDLQSKEIIVVISDKGLFSGQIVNNCNLSIKDNKLYANLKIKSEKYKNKLYKIRKNIIEGIKRTTDSSLFVALISGNKIYLSKDTIELFRKVGCSHILALSGFHVSIISLIILFFSRIILTGDKIYYLTAIILIIFLFFVGISASLLRSVIMFLVSITFRKIGIKVTLLRILIITFYIIIIISPAEFYSLSFQLSFLALLGILLISNEIKKIKIISILPKIIKIPISTSIAALIATSFVVYPLFGVIYPIGIMVSVLLTPIITLYIILGILSLLLPILSELIKIIENIIYLLLEFFSNIELFEVSGINSSIVTLTIIIIPVILVILKINRSRDARRFNIKFKL